MFSVTFRGNSPDAYIIRVSPPDGLKALDAACATLGPQVDFVARQAYDFCEFEICCRVSEEQARKAFFRSGAFGESRQVTVKVPPEALNRWTCGSWRLMPGSDTIAEWIPSIRYADIVDAWLADGAPLEWTPSGYEPSATPAKDDNQ
jgi:hypothetical protein